MVIQGLFRSWHRENRLLSDFLNSAYAAPAQMKIARMSAEEIEEPDETLIRLLVDEMRVQPPRLLGQERASVGEGRRRPGSGGIRHLTERHYIAVQVEGEIELLDYWPDAAESELQPIDAAPLGEGEAGFRACPPELEHDMRTYELELAQERWFLGDRTDHGPRALYTWLDLTQEDEEDVARGELDLHAEVNKQRARIEPIVTAIAAQTTAFFDSDLPEKLRVVIEARRRQIEARRAVQASLTWPNGWKYPEPRLEADPALIGGGVAAPSPQDVHVEQRSRLADATFDDVIRTIRIWVDAVERHPKAYASLVEDRISDLLTATLNAALPGAHREVYSRGGKSDIYIRADAVNAGAGPAKVFICECKWWRGASKAQEALTQLFGYLDNKDTAAVLMFFVPLANPSVAHMEARQALAARGEFLDAKVGAAGWPVLRFETNGRSVSVCLAFADLPRT
ncbi:hypothetical protein AB0873_28455 [Micromonospora sp. NPDC047707]|uniref:hypothetical protein n=1 Tax=Micromonospora sp. NPDC047707 TaxID=3154498 RepID=UPI003453D301